MRVHVAWASSGGIPQPLYQALAQDRSKLGDKIRDRKPGFGVGLMGLVQTPAGKNQFESNNVILVSSYWQLGILASVSKRESPASGASTDDKYIRQEPSNISL